MIHRRRKSLLTILVVLSFFLYINWFVSLSTTNHILNDKNQDLRLDQAAAIKRRELKFEAFEAYAEKETPENSIQSSISSSSSTKYAKTTSFSVPLIDTDPKISQFILLTPKKVDSKSVQISTGKIDQSDLGSILQVLFTFNAYLVDVDMLNTLKFKDEELNNKNKNKLEILKHSRYEIFTFSNVKHFYNQKNDTNNEPVFITMGIDYDRAETLAQAFLNNPLFTDLKKCHLVQSTNSYADKTILSSLYIVCNENRLLIQIALFYRRGSFYWIAQDEFKLEELNFENKNMKKIFGDKPRAINRYKCFKI
jgi:hypothetical protein